MEQAQNEGSELAFGEGTIAPAPSPPAGSTSLKQLEADEAQRVIPTRRKLGDEQERELTRLYADTTMPVSEIARMYGIGESSVYRVAQRHGAALRGRQTPPGAPQAKPATSGARVRPGARAAASVAKPPETPSTPAVAGAPARVRPRDANARDAAPTAALAHTERGRPVLERGSELGAPRSVGSGFASWRSGSCKLGIFKTRSARRSPSRQSRSPPSRARNSNSPRKMPCLGHASPGSRWHVRRRRCHRRKGMSCSTLLTPIAAYALTIKDALRPAWTVPTARRPGRSSPRSVSSGGVDSGRSDPHTRWRAPSASSRCTWSSSIGGKSA